jgi:NADPH:quinone reductase-like Zn-dependent oxidoreductase
MSVLVTGATGNVGSVVAFVPEQRAVSVGRQTQKALCYQKWLASAILSTVIANRGICRER